jgi:hypothetical protein
MISKGIEKYMNYPQKDRYRSFRGRSRTFTPCLGSFCTFRVVRGGAAGEWCTMPGYMLFVSIAYTHYCALFIFSVCSGGGYMSFQYPRGDHWHATVVLFLLQGVEKYPKRRDRLSMGLFFIDRDCYPE